MVSLSLLAMGLIAMAACAQPLLAPPRNDALAYAVGLVVSMVFTGFAVQLLVSQRAIVFDRERMQCLRGKKLLADLKQVIGLQLLDERVASSEVASFRSTELNLVFRLPSDGRLTIVDHADGDLLAE